MGHNEISCSYCTCKKHNKVAPSHHISVHIEYIEVHPKRRFRVIHILPFSNLSKCKRESESIHGSVQSEKNDITSSSTETNNETDYSFHKWRNQITCIWCCCGNRDSLIPKFSFLLKYAENISNIIVSEAVRLVSCRKGSKTFGSSRRSQHFHCPNSESLNNEPENSTDLLTSRLKGKLKYSNSQKSLSVPVFTASRRITLSKRLNSLIFFIHGLGGSADVWQYQLMFFSSQGYEVVAFDLLGHGMSSAPDDQEMYVFPEMLNDILLIFDHYAKQRNVVVGHSYGCAFASSLCEKRHHAVKQLILISGGGPKPLEPRQGLAAFLPVCGLTLLKYLTCYCFRTEQEGSSHLMELIRISALPRYILKYVLQGQRWEEGDRLFYRSLYSPALLIYGSKDYFISLHDEIEMEKTMPYARLEVISNAGHSVMLDTPNELNELIFKFLLSWET